MRLSEINGAVRDAAHAVLTGAVRLKGISGLVNFLCFRLKAPFELPSQISWDHPSYEEILIDSKTIEILKTRVKGWLTHKLTDGRLRNAPGHEKTKIQLADDELVRDIWNVIESCVRPSIAREYGLKSIEIAGSAWINLSREECLTSYETKKESADALVWHRDYDYPDCRKIFLEFNLSNLDIKSHLKVTTLSRFGLGYKRVSLEEVCQAPNVNLNDNCLVMIDTSQPHAGVRLADDRLVIQYLTIPKKLKWRWSGFNCVSSH